MLKRVLLLLCIVVGFAACGMAQTPNDTLIVGLTHASMTDFEPAAIYNFESGLIAEQVYETLVTFRGGVNAFETIAPGLAESWERSADGLTWTFKIRQGATFHSGNPVNAEAVVFSLRRSIAHENAPGVWIITQFVPTPDMIQQVD